MRFALNEAELAKLEPHQAEQVKREFAALQRRAKQNPLEGWEPHLKQRPFLASTKPIKLFAGGNRSGKTTCGVVDNLVQSLDRELVPEHLRPFKKWEPPFYMRYLSPDLVDTMEAVLFPKIRALVPPAALHGGSFDKAYSKQHRMLRFKNGSWWQFMSFEQDVAKMGGAALHRVHFDEEPPLTVRRENQMRLLDFSGDELFTMTPLHGMTWLYDAIYRRAEDVDYIEVVEVDIDDNPHVDRATRDRTLAEFPPEERAARKSGRFVSFAGLIYPEFSVDKHVVPQHSPPEGAECYVGIDPGMQFMCAVVFCYLTDDDRLVVYDELAADNGERIDQVAKQILLMNAGHGAEPRWYVIDPAARNRNPQTGRSDQMVFADYGVVALAGQNAVRPGISEIKRRLDTGKLEIGANCTELIRELERYRWKAPTKHAEAEEDDHRSRPVKKDDHLLDALRYVAMSRPLPPEPDEAGPELHLHERLLAEDFDRSFDRSMVRVHQAGNIYI